MTINATSGNDQIEVTTTKINGLRSPIEFSKITNLSINALGGDDFIAAGDGVVENIDGGSGTNLAVLDDNDVAVNVTCIGATIAGRIFNDANSNATQESGETGVVGRTVYLDTNNNNVLDAGETSTTTVGEGRYWFYDVPAGTRHVKQVLATGYRKTLPASGTPGYDVVVTANSFWGGKDFCVTSNIYLGGTVFKDTNGNGVQDAGESGIPFALVIGTRRYGCSRTPLNEDRPIAQNKASFLKQFSCRCPVPFCGFVVPVRR